MLWYARRFVIFAAGWLLLARIVSGFEWRDALVGALVTATLAGVVFPFLLRRRARRDDQ